MTKEKQIEEMVDVMTESNNPFIDIPTEQMIKAAEALYGAGYRKTFTSDLSSDTQKAFKEGYIKGSIDSMLLARKETAKEILDLIVDESGVDLLGAYYKLPIRTYNKIKREYGVGVEE